MSEHHEPPPGALPPDPALDPAGAVADEALIEAVEEAAEGRDAYARGARILSIGIASTGLFTFAFFAAGSHALGEERYGPVALLWSILFVAMCVFYRPVEQLLSRQIATARARGEQHPSLREPLLIQLGFAVALLAAAFAAKGFLEDPERLGDGGLFWVLIGAAAAYAASYFARGFVAGHQWFGLYGGLVLFESLARILFPIAVLLGVATGQIAVALGIVAAPLASLLVVPWAIRSAHGRIAAGGAAPEASGRGDALRAGGGFAVAVALIQLGEQTLVNAGTLLANDKVLAGVIFNALLVTRAPLQLFQAVQTSLLPHLSQLDATSDQAAFSRAIRLTVLAIVGFAAVVAVGLLAIGPWAMGVVFGADHDYGRVGLAVVAVGMGAHLVAGTLNQAALARGHAATAAAAWLVAAGLFVAWMLTAPVDDKLVRAEVGYGATALVLCGLLYLVYRRRAAAAR
ncbi:lipopolysaccharide biosynthesis protein [Patulibacter defluvii]|uniref:lipopolysaccharide biosynthesis protein n=1 Tax=Patulibacter defluvii TaxID=3095358 RepID=UPI002A75D9A8|nr:hypothetical protein [Patulibacter sp. DM4]